MQQSEKYAYKVCQLKSFSKAAEKLFISQPSLSATVKKLEKELGFKIFDRSKTPVALTPEGEIYYEYLEETIKSETETLRRIKTLKKPVTQKLSVGGSNYISHILLPKICGKFADRFPDTEIRLDMGQTSSVRNLYEKLAEGTIDIMMSHTCDKDKFDFVPLFEEKYVIAIRKDAPGAKNLLPYSITREEVLSGNTDKEITDYSVFEGVTFIRYGKGGSTWKYMHKLLEHCSFSNIQISGSRSLETHYDMMLYGQDAVITTEILISQRPEKSSELLYFLTNTSRPVMLIYKKGVQLSESAKEFISLASETYSSKDSIYKSTCFCKCPEEKL